MIDFLHGATMMGLLVAAAFFFTFYRQSADRLFLLFGLAFLVFAANRLALLFVEETSEIGTGVFLIRLAGFVLILIAVIDKNRTPTAKGPDG